MPRDHIEFTALAVQGLTPEQAERVGVALDCAVAFGALEFMDNNSSLQNYGVVREAFDQKLERLRGMP